MIWNGDVGDHCNNIGDVGDYCDNIGDVGDYCDNIGDYCDNQMHGGDVCIGRGDCTGGSLQPAQMANSNNRPKINQLNQNH